MNQVMNQSFRDWSSTRKFPFTDGSDMTCTDGRRIPLSAFTMITLFPDTEGSARISEINETGILFDMEGWTAFAAFSGYSDGWMPIMKEGSCVGSVMTNDNDLLYIKGMASFQSMVFTEGHLDLRPETVKGFCLDEPQLLPLPTFFGMPAITMTVSLDSARYSVSSGKVNLNTTATVTNQTYPVSYIGNGSNTYAANPSGCITIRTPDWCDSQFIVKDGQIVFHQRGS
jgi:hypothetical protein